MFNKLFGSFDDEINLSSKEFHAKMKEGNTIILDVRTPEEYADGFIKGAINIDYYDDFQGKIGQYDKDKNYLLYCRSGSRSASAISLMKKLGFSNVSHLCDGIINWDQPLETRV